MALSKNYTPADAEEKWYQHWQNKGYFHSKPDGREPFTIVIPPPNVTGVLHMGHTLNETIQDTLIRRARMNGKNACWVPGSDHASIATEAKVVAMLKEKGINKQDLSRADFLKHAFEWKEKYGGIIYQQMKKLGCSCDWQRTGFTMDDHYYKAVIKIFVQLYNQGLIYRGARMINWDPEALTALSDEEVEHREVQSKLYYIRYPLEDNDDFITIATTRPETILGDSAICVHPDDIRYKKLVGKKAKVPLINRPIPVIADEYVDQDFGTGCLKITPAHDINDYNIGLKHKLEVIDVLNPNGTLSEAAQLYVGEDRFVVRKKIVKELAEKGFLVKEESITNKNGFSQRTNAVVEPRISTQWFVQMEELAASALKAVEDKEIKLFPDGRFNNTYRHWLENIKDWCISRQLWWGQRIPAWYDKDGNVYVAETEEEAQSLKQKAENRKSKAESSNSKARNEGSAAPLPLGEAGRGLEAGWGQDEDVLDTWFSSWLWPMEVFHGITKPDNEEFSYYYPTNVLVTGQDIIFFWVARMVMAGYEFKQTKPFEDVYFTGMVRDKQGRKMSKSLGNSPDLLQLIEKFGADAVRFGIMISSPAGNDLLFDESALEQGRNFCNKMWNALKLTRLWQVADGNMNSSEQFAIDWFGNKLAQAKTEINNHFENYRLSEALKLLYSLIWNDFCSWYLEWIKPLPGEKVHSIVYQKTQEFFEELLALLHPFMPFVTEEIYHQIKERKEGEDLIVKQQTIADGFDAELLAQGELARNTITAIRDTRNKNGIKNKEAIKLHIQTGQEDSFKAFKSILARQINAASIQFVKEAMPDSIAVVVDKNTVYIEAPEGLDQSAQKEKLLKDLAHQEGFLVSVNKKLSNERFVQNANPELVERERNKKSDAEARIKIIRESLERLG